VRELRRLALEQAAIDAAGSRRKRSVGTLIDDLAAIEHQNPIEAAHRRQAVAITIEVRPFISRSIAC
jgi:hypothetical protein